MRTRLLVEKRADDDVFVIKVKMLFEDVVVEEVSLT